MIDLIPEGYISLVEAYELYFDQLWNGCSPTVELGDHERYRDLPVEIVREHNERLEQIRQIEWDGIIHPFIDGSLEAFVKPPGSKENYTIPKTAWADMFFPERVFLSTPIVAGLGDYWDSIVGRTPFVRRGQYEDWLGLRSSVIVQLLRQTEPRYLEMRDFLTGLAMDGVAASGEVEEMAKRWGVAGLAFDPGTSDKPMENASWSLPMGIAWIVWRTPEAVCGQWDEYRSQCRDWVSFHRRLPLDGGRRWYEVEGEELHYRDSASLGSLALVEATQLLSETDTDHPMLMSVKSARETLWNNLANGILRMSATDPNGDIVEIPAHEWPYLEIAHKADLADYLINRHNSLEAAYNNLTFRSSDILRLWPSQRTNRGVLLSNQIIAYKHDERFWNFFEACLWIGCEGEELLSDEIATNDLDILGADKLFAALNEKRLVATGINRKLVRENIPSEYWELATLDGEKPGHCVEFIDDAALGFWGTLTPSGDDSPRWDRINIDSHAMKRVFPFKKSKPVSCRHWLESCMRESPGERPMTKADYLKESQKHFNISKADFGRAWNQALDNVLEAKPFWKKGGRPKNPSK